MWVWKNEGGLRRNEVENAGGRSAKRRPSSVISGEELSLAALGLAPSQGALDCRQRRGGEHERTILIGYEAASGCQFRPGLDPVGEARPLDRRSACHQPPEQAELNQNCLIPVRNANN